MSISLCYSIFQTINVIGIMFIDEWFPTCSDLKPAAFRDLFSLQGVLICTALCDTKEVLLVLDDLPLVVWSYLASFPFPDGF